MATVELEAGGYHYAEYGDPSAPPLVLLHEMPSDCSTWAGIAPELAAGYRVVAPDQRGHGSSARTATYSLEEMREDLRQFADALGLDQFVLGGHSGLDELLDVARRQDCPHGSGRGQRLRRTS
jgi:esterase